MKHYTIVKNETGAVMLVSLILLLLMTLFVMANMNTALLQEKMAANSQNYNRLLQASESAVAANVRAAITGSNAVLSAAVLNNRAPTPEISFDVGDANISTTVTVKHNGQAQVGSGGSISADRSSTTLTAQLFQTEATSELSGSSASSTIIQGFTYN